MATDLSSIAGALKQVYGQYNVQQNLKHKALDEIAKSLTKYSNGGQGYFGAINDYGNESGGAINETQSFNTIDNENYQQFKVVPKVIVWADPVLGSLGCGWRFGRRVLRQHRDRCS
jgi:hypothetical protein